MCKKVDYNTYGYIHDREQCYMSRGGVKMNRIDSMRRVGTVY